MTDKQMNYILYLDDLCVRQGIKMNSCDEDLLGKDWFSSYKNITLDYTNEVINKMKKALGLPISEFKRGKKK